MTIVFLLLILNAAQGSILSRHGVRGLQRSIFAALPATPDLLLWKILRLEPSQAQEVVLQKLDLPQKFNLV